MWVFILPGLYLYEKKSLRIILLISILLFFLSSQLGYWYIFPVAFDFFLSFQVIGLEKLYHLELQAKMQEYLILNMQLFFSLAFCFQFPIILILLSKLKLITLSWLVQKRKYFYVLAFVLAAIISPPDVISQFIIAIPILLFFECSIFALEWIEMYTKKRLETC
jgi:sec-independent protein translocase protein TatC